MRWTITVAAVAGALCLVPPPVTANPLATTQRELAAARIAYLDAYAAALDDRADLALVTAMEGAP